MCHVCDYPTNEKAHGKAKKSLAEAAAHHEHSLEHTLDVHRPAASSTISVFSLTVIVWVNLRSQNLAVQVMCFKNRRKIGISNTF